jgi:hypothetical protein
MVEDFARQASAIRAALSATPGSRGCDVISTREGILVITLGDDETAVVESGRRFVAWLDRHVPAIRSTAPEIWAGEVIVDDRIGAADKEGSRP